MTERTTVRLPSDLLARARKKAAAEGRTLTSLIEDGLRAVVAERPGFKERQRVRLPVSRARGGLLPGFDPEKLATQAQELDDVEYVGRTQHLK